MDPLHVALGASIALAVGLAVIAFARSRGLRRRLFLAIALASLLPAAALATLTVSNTRTVLGVLEAPGLREGVDAGLSLARAWLEREEGLLIEHGRAVARALDAPGPAEPDPTDAEIGWWSAGAGGGLDLAPWLETDALPAPGEAARRVASEAGTVLLLAVQRDDGTPLVVGRRLAADVVADLEAVRQGSRGVRQLELFYRPMLATALLTVTVVSLVGIVLIGTLVGRDVSARLVRPLSELLEGTRRVAGGDLESRVHVRAAGEAGELVEAFNGMTARLAEGERRLRRSERLAAWQGIARRLAHEIKNPLTPIQLAAHRLRRRTEDPVSLESLAAIEEEVVNLQRLAEEFSALGRLPDPRPEPLGLADVVERAADLYVPEGIACTVAIDPGLAVHADAGQLGQVASNLLKNAVQALGARGRIDVGARDAGDAVVWTIDDDGPGLGDDPARVFDAGYTTRSTGTGLGLAIVQRIVEDHGGSIDAGASPHGGARFTVHWPSRDVAGGERVEKVGEVSG